MSIILHGEVVRRHFIIPLKVEVAQVLPVLHLVLVDVDGRLAVLSTVGVVVLPVLGSWNILIINMLNRL